MNLFLRTALFTSALAPAVLIGAIGHAWRTGGDQQTWFYILATIFMCMLPFIILNAAKRKSSEIPFIAKKIKSQEWVLVIMVVSYLIPVVGKIDELEYFTLLFLLAAILLAFLEAIPNHPVLHVFRYRFYEVEGGNGTMYTLITYRRLLNASDLKTVRQLSPQLLLEI